MQNKKRGLFIKLALFIQLIMVSVLTSATPALWTADGARLQLVNTQASNNVNWILLPGGPGDGTEYLQGLASKLKLPGNTWLLDLPGNGSNELAGKTVDFNQWPKYLVAAVASLPNVVLVAHSFGGMLALSSPELQQHLKGLVLISTAPDNSYQQASEQLTKQLHIPGFDAEKHYYLVEHHDDAGLKHVNIAIAKNYDFTPKFAQQGEALVTNMSYSHKAFDWGLNKFIPNYKALWVPKNIPVLILAGEKDVLIPPNVFLDNAAFHQPNIKLVVIPHAAHYLWIDNAAATFAAITAFAASIGGLESQI